MGTEFNMIVAIGTDLVDLERLAKSIERSGEAFIDKFLTPGEREYCDGRTVRLPSIGARFAAKEAVMKCFGTGWAEGLGFRDIEVQREASGQPIILLHGEAIKIAKRLGITKIHVSLSHSNGHAIATAVAENDS